MILIDDDQPVTSALHGVEVLRQDSSSSLFSRRRIGGNLEPANAGELEMLREFDERLKR